jgi:sporulation protein YlmC with PRC-barrel domain
MRRKHVLITSATALAMSAAPLALAQAQSKQTDKIDIASWNRADLYDGWTVEQLYDTQVRDSAGEDIGEIENLVIDADGQVTKIVVEAGGVFDIGDTHFAVNWDEVEFGPDLEWVQVPVDEDNLENFSLFDGDDEVTTGPRAWRASELINDYVTLEDMRGYGIVQDIVISQDGKVEAVVVYPDVAYGVGGPYAYPYYGYGYDPAFDPGAETYDLPYTMSEVQELGPFDYSQLRVPMAGGMQGDEATMETEEQQG